MANKVFRVNRSLIGRELTGNVALPVGYRTSFGLSADEVTVFADFTAAQLNKKAVFMINVNLQEIDSLSTSDPALIPLSENWHYFGVAEILQIGTIYSAHINVRTDLGICGIAAYCPDTAVGNNITVTL